MLKTLRITSLATAVIAVVGVVFVLFFGLGPDKAIRQFLQQESITGQMRKKEQTVVKNEDTISPLVTQAKAFALRIDPPPPPAPPKTEKNTAANTVQPARPQPPAPPPTTSKFKLIATARYADYPEKSLALLDLVSEGLKWFGQGQDLGHFQIHEVRDGSIVLYQNGKFSSELSVPPQPQTVKSLLKADAAGSYATATAAMGVASADSVAAIILPIRQPAAADTGHTQLSDNSAVRVTRRLGEDTGSAPLNVRRPREPEPVLTPQQQTEQLDQSINSIKQMMAAPATEKRDPKELAEENKAWEELLNTLEQERKNLERKKSSDKTPSDAPENTDKPSEKE